MAETAKSSPATHSHAGSAGCVVVDLGRKSRSDIRRLRKGEGKLFAEVEQITAQLKLDRIEGQPVFVVEERQSDVRWW
jgi:hypothetical protein